MSSTKSTSDKQPTFRGRIYDNITQTIGATPLVRLDKLAAAHNCQATIVGKCEFFNPLGSVKDRIGLNMIEAAEADGRIGPGAVIVEPTSGNTGIGLAMVCAAKGYRLIICLPETHSEERRKMLLLLGAEVELTPMSEGMSGAIKRAQEIVSKTPNALILQQFENLANPDIHRRTTAEEIWADTDGQVDVVIAGAGTGGTLTGIAEVIKERKPEFKIIAVEPEDSPVLSGGVPGVHRLSGIGPGFIPKIINTDILDEIICIGSNSAFSIAREVAKLEGVAVGISSGATLSAAIEVGQRPDMAGKLIVAILASSADRYMSTELFDGLSV
ncbi:MAG: cysteine synthase A [Rhodospirillales bacterium]